jgi:hypothetical protein
VFGKTLKLEMADNEILCGSKGVLSMEREVRHQRTKTEKNQVKKEML